jgi:2-methylcitrate dehydratase PrpD
MSQTVIQRLAERIRSFGDKNVTKQAIELSRTAIIDTIGVTLAGSVEPCATNLLRTPGIAEAPGPCALFGTKRKASALDATFFSVRCRRCDHRLVLTETRQAGHGGVSPRSADAR